TVRLMQILAKAAWIPPPLAFAGDIFGEITPKEVMGILMNVWDFIKDFPPTPSVYVIKSSSSSDSNNNKSNIDRPSSLAWDRDFGESDVVEPYIAYLKVVLSNNLDKGLVPAYIRFFGDRHHSIASVTSSSSSSSTITPIPISISFSTS